MGNRSRQFSTRQWFPTFSRVHAPDAVAYSEMRGDHNALRRTSLAWSNVGGLAVRGDHNLIEECIIHDVNWWGNYGYAGILVSAAGRRGEPSPAVQRQCAGDIAMLYNGQTRDNHVFDAGKAWSLAAVHTGSSECRGSRAHHWIRGSSGIGLRGDDQDPRADRPPQRHLGLRFYGIMVKGDDNLVYHNTTIGGRSLLVIPTDHEVVNAHAHAPCRATCSTTRPRPCGSRQPLADVSRIEHNVVKANGKGGVPRTRISLERRLVRRRRQAWIFRPARSRRCLPRASPRFTQAATPRHYQRRNDVLDSGYRWWTPTSACRRRSPTSARRGTAQPQG